MPAHPAGGHDDDSRFCGALLLKPVQDSGEGCRRVLVELGQMGHDLDVMRLAASGSLVVMLPAALPDRQQQLVGQRLSAAKDGQRCQAGDSPFVDGIVVFLQNLL